MSVQDLEQIRAKWTRATNMYANQVSKADEIGPRERCDNIPYKMYPAECRQNASNF